MRATWRRLACLLSTSATKVVALPWSHILVFARSHICICAMLGATTGRPTRHERQIPIVLHFHVFVPRVLCLLLREDKRIVRRLKPCHSSLGLNVMAWMESQRGSSGPVWQV